MTNSQSNSSSHARCTASLKVTFDLLQCVDTLALQVAFASDTIHRRGGETVLNLQTVSHHTLKQFALRLRHEIRLLCRFGLHKPQPPDHRAKAGLSKLAPGLVRNPSGSKEELTNAQKTMAGAAGLEPVTSAVTGQRSNQLSYAPAWGSRTYERVGGASSRTRL